MDAQSLLPVIGFFLSGWLFGGLLILVPRYMKLARRRRMAPRRRDHHLDG